MPRQLKQEKGMLGGFDSKLGKSLPKTAREVIKQHTAREIIGVLILIEFIGSNQYGSSNILTNRDLCQGSKKRSIGDRKGILHSKGRSVEQWA